MRERIDPCVICEKHMEGVVCDEHECPVAMMKSYNANLEAANSHISNTLLDELAKARVEAIKEFAERIKQTRVDFGGIEMVAVGNIDTISKEMTEE